MRVFTHCELIRSTRQQLQAWLDRISAALPAHPEGSLDRRIALINIQNITRELTRRQMTSGVWRR
jgi:hypothetical protein